MKPLLRVLNVEDSEDDSRLLLRELERSDYEIAHERVETAEALTCRTGPGKLGHPLLRFHHAAIQRAKGIGDRQENGILICHLFSSQGRSVRTLRFRP